MSGHRIGQLEIDSPWGNAGGLLRTPEDVYLAAHSGIGWVEVGSTTREKRDPQDAIPYSHDPITGTTLNALRMPNAGMDQVELDIPEMKSIAEAHDKALIFNVAPVSYEPVEETRELVSRAYDAGADLVLVNLGCRNVLAEDGSRHEVLSYNLPAMKLVLAGLLPELQKRGRYVAVRTSPYKNYEQAAGAFGIIAESGVVSTVFTPNSWLEDEAIDESSEELATEDKLVSKSGPVTADDAFRQTVWATTRLRRSGVDVVSSGGIMNGQELARRMKIGAVAGAGTTFFYESAEEGWSEATDRLLWEYMAAVETPQMQHNQ